jgi:peptidoglycan/xylan/chitin deacetylase (PgdA/CDA1 family)
LRIRRIPVRSSSLKSFVRSAVKECGTGVLRLLGVFRLFRWLHRHRLVILTYHSVLPSTSDIDAGEARNVVDEEMFAWQMQYLATHFRCLRLEDAVELLAGDRPLPEYSVVVTFDDGFQNNLRYAFPILRRLGVPATIFLTTGHIGRGTQLLWTERVGRMLRRAKVPDDAARLELKRLKSMTSRDRDAAIQEMERTLGRATNDAADVDPDRYTFLTWSEVQELARGGITIGSHTVAHPIMASLDDERRSVEVLQSKQDIERHLGRPCALFSYPNGTADDFGDRDKASLRAAGYVAAVTQIAGVNDKHADRFALRRMNIGRGHTPQLFIAQVSGFWPWMRALAARVRSVPSRGKFSVARTETLSE